MDKSNLKTILITGANKGIGHGIVKALIESQSKANTWRYKVILTSRDTSRGQEAISDLFKNFGDIKDYLVYRQLDITNEQSILDISNWIKKEFGSIDILLNNAGIAFKGQQFDTFVFDTTFNTNFYGTVNITEKFLSENLIKESGKIIVIGSSLGNMKKKLSENLLKEFQNSAIDNEKLYELAKRFRESIEKGTNQDEGWGSSVYAVSKMCINTYASIIGRREDVLSNNIQVYSCCPGWVRTDMAGPNAHKSIEEGVMCPIYLVELEHKINKEFQGKFFEDCKLSDIGI